MVVRRTERGAEIVDCGSGLKVTCHSDVSLWIEDAYDARLLIAHLQAWNWRKGSLDVWELVQLRWRTRPWLSLGRSEMHLAKRNH